MYLEYSSAVQLTKSFSSTSVYVYMEKEAGVSQLAVQSIKNK